MNRGEVRKLILILVGVYTGKIEIDENGVTLASWEYALKEFSFQEGEQAVRRYIQSGKEWPPHAGQIASIIRRAKFEQDPIKDHEQAWNVAIRIASQYGASRKREAARSAQLASNRLYRVIKNFGYERLCELFPQQNKINSSSYDGRTAGATLEDIKFSKIRWEKLFREYEAELKESGYIGHQESLALGNVNKPIENLVNATSSKIKGAA